MLEHYLSCQISSAVCPPAGMGSVRQTICDDECEKMLVKNTLKIVRPKRTLIKIRELIFENDSIWSSVFFAIDLILASNNCHDRNGTKAATTLEKVIR